MSEHGSRRYRRHSSSSTRDRSSDSPRPGLTLLAEVSDRMRMQRAVPFAADKEVRRQSRRYAAVSRRWPAAVMPGRFEVLGEVAVGVADQRVVAEAARLRDTDPDSALSAQRDLGEILTVAHAVVARSDGLQVAVSTDDSYGARLAGAEQLLNLDTVAILRLAIRLGLITAKTDLQTLYRALSLYSHLPPSLPPGSWKRNSGTSAATVFLVAAIPRAVADSPGSVEIIVHEEDSSPSLEGVPHTPVMGSDLGVRVTGGCRC